VQYDNNSKDIIKSVNGKTVYGTGGWLPRRQYTQISLQTGRKVTTLNTNLLNDLFEPVLQATDAFITNYGVIYLTASNSDAAGAYIVVWIFKQKGSITRQVFRGE
jgi:hypothetical protein